MWEWLILSRRLGPSAVVWRYAVWSFATLPSLWRYRRAGLLRTEVLVAQV